MLHCGALHERVLKATAGVNVLQTNVLLLFWPHKIHSLGAPPSVGARRHWTQVVWES